MTILKLIVCLFIPQFIGFLSATLAGDSFMRYSMLDKPPFSPPGEAFGIAWPILYFLMGLASFFIVKSTAPVKKALTLYAVQLFMNFMWMLFFFKWDMRLFAFFWLIALLCVIIATFKEFKRISTIASILLIPYILWILYAGYLNIGVWYLNR